MTNYIAECKRDLKNQARIIRDLKNQSRDAHKSGYHTTGNSAFWEAHNLGIDFRYLHVAYCLLRCRSYSLIEPKVKPTKLLDAWTLEQKINYLTGGRYEKFICDRGQKLTPRVWSSSGSPCSCAIFDRISEFAMEEREAYRAQIRQLRITPQDGGCDLQRTGS